jgi:hypothetical protein
MRTSIRRRDHDRSSTLRDHRRARATRSPRAKIFRAIDVARGVALMVRAMCDEKFLYRVDDERRAITCAMTLSTHIATASRKPA